MLTFTRAHENWFTVLTSKRLEETEKATANNISKIVKNSRKFIEKGI